jgi:hypothetical protein
MSVAELLPWLNLLVLPALGLLIKVEHRLTRLEAIVERVERDLVHA